MHMLMWWLVGSSLISTLNTMPMDKTQPKKPEPKHVTFHTDTSEHERKERAALLSDGSMYPGDIGILDDEIVRADVLAEVIRNCVKKSNGATIDDTARAITSLMNSEPDSVQERICFNLLMPTTFKRPVIVVKQKLKHAGSELLFAHNGDHTLACIDKQMSLRFENTRDNHDDHQHTWTLPSGAYALQPDESIAEKYCTDISKKSSIDDMSDDKPTCVIYGALKKPAKMAISHNKRYTVRAKTVKTVQPSQYQTSIEMIDHCQQHSRVLSKTSNEVVVDIDISHDGEYIGVILGRLSGVSNVTSHTPQSTYMPIISSLSLSIMKTRSSYEEYLCYAALDGSSTFKQLNALVHSDAFRKVKPAVLQTAVKKAVFEKMNMIPRYK